LPAHSKGLRNKPGSWPRCASSVGGRGCTQKARSGSEIYANNFSTTSPCTSVSRKSRP
jgi:hypothetical protein